ncbi:XRE family transcriptional regulator [Exiguobacterium sp. SH5S4]|uniref:helix-turn-helix domain-containing protein n=1 Tax=Exiguobacterium sp. SH5S4 TaxID=2510961 RepID=UPI00103FF3E8|nr:helix-turn-helix transcriptional regulator [Exiguobacterium sp. SH5S4]TCI26716.1 XRE family transcriptional regulator [Exiguobacterium sp. SH5S4]
MRVVDYLIELSPQLKRKTRLDIYPLSLEIINIRVKRNMSQEELADDLGIEVSALAKYEFADEQYGIDEYKMFLERLKLSEKK